MAETLYEGRDIEVRGEWPHPGRPLVVTFGPRQAGRKVASVFAEQFLQQRNLNFIGFVARRNIWWQTPEVAEALEKIGMAALAERFPSVVTYGTSMGAHGALVAAHLCRATRIIAFSPQFSMHRPDLPLHDIWRFEMKGIPEVYRFDPEWGRRCEILVGYDPFHAHDRAHVHAMADQARLTELRVPFSGHNAAQMLRNCHLLSGAVTEMIEGRFDPRRFHADLRERKRQVVDYWQGLASASARRPALRAEAQRRALELAIAQIRASNPDVPHRYVAMMLRNHCLALAADGRFEEADELAATYAANYPAVGSGHAIRAELAMSRGDHDAADAHVLRAIEVRRKDVKALLLRARIGLAAGRWRVAENALRAALRMPPSDSKGWGAVARMLQQPNQVDAALRDEALERARSLAPGSVRAAPAARLDDSDADEE